MIIPRETARPTLPHPGDGTADVMKMSAAEARFERIRQTSGFFVGPVAFLGVLFFPIPGLSTEAHHLAAVVALVVSWWVSEAIPIPATALVGTAMLVLMGVAPAREAFAPFANPIIFLFIGSFMLGRAISIHELDRRLALKLLSLRVVRGRFSRVHLALALFGLGVSAWMSNTATMAMIIPIAMGVLSSSAVLRNAGGRQYTAGFLLTLAYAIAAGGLMTPVGSPPNLITIGLLSRLAGVEIDFLTWMMLTVPVGVTLGALIFVVAARMFPGLPAGAVVPPTRSEEPARMNRGQRFCLFAFGVAVVLWVTPGVFELFASDATPGWTLVRRLDEGVVAIIAATLLFFLPVSWRERRFALEWSDASRIDWGTILLFGAGLSLGEQMFKTGLAETVGISLVQFTGAETLWAITALAIALGIVLTEVTSNTATANMLVPVVISMCLTTGLNPVPPALGACMGASMAFMLPISTPPNAIVYGTGYIRITEMVRFGIVLDVIGFFVAFGGLRIMCPLLGLA